ncbi:hypothetical protein [Roseibium album]|uniref:DUF968 domain-containing protein n=1 Tax=Roseibium album TaxID=311410 RepID=UPI003BAF79C3
MSRFLNPHQESAFNTGIGRKTKNPVRKDKAYLSWIHELPCVISGRVGDGVQSAHIRYGDIAYAKPQAGKGEKSDDIWVLPLFHTLHTEQHDVGNELVFWQSYGLNDPLAICTRLYAVYPSVERAELIINNLPHSMQRRSGG